ncbi:MAG: hypothetical protein ACQCN3_01915 [Candidatus Bathyarchaeia archaeon]
MVKNKKKYGALLTALVAIIIISPLDDILIATLCGGALFGFGSLQFYLLMAGSSVASITVWAWRKQNKHTTVKTSFNQKVTKQKRLPFA